MNSCYRGQAQQTDGNDGSDNGAHGQGGAGLTGTPDTGRWIASLFQQRDGLRRDDVGGAQRPQVGQAFP